MAWKHTKSPTQKLKVILTSTTLMTVTNFHLARNYSFHSTLWTGPWTMIRKDTTENRSIIHHARPHTAAATIHPYHSKIKTLEGSTTACDEIHWGESIILLSSHLSQWWRVQTGPSQTFFGDRYCLYPSIFYQFGKTRTHRDTQPIN